MSQETINNKNVIKFIFLGCYSVGKSSMHLRMFEEQYCDDNYLNKMQLLKTIIINEHSFTFTIWDLYGCEKYQLVFKPYAENAKGVLFVYNILEQRTFNALDKWIDNARVIIKDALIYIVGNKIDKDNERIITKEQAIQLCNKKNAKYYECSALTKENIFELVYLFFLDYLNQEENQKKKQKINFIPSLTRDDTNNKTDCIIY